MDIHLQVFLDGSPTQTPRKLLASNDMLVSETIECAVAKYESDIQAGGGELPSNWGLFDSSTNTWLSPSRDLDSYELTSDVPLLLRLRRAPLTVALPDSSTKRIPVDWTQPVKSVVREIGDRLSLGAFADTYGLQLAPFEAAKFQCGTCWLDGEVTLEQQKVKPTDTVYFYKRFIDIFAAGTTTNSSDEHICFSQLSSCFLQGFYDNVLHQNLTIELAACLTALARGRAESKHPPHFFQEISSVILSPKWRKKTKWEFHERLALSYLALSQQHLSSDSASLKRHFLRCLSKIGSIGSLFFPADGIRLGDGSVFESSEIQVSCMSVTMTSKRSGSDKSSSATPDRPPISIPLDTVLRSSVVQTVTTFSFMNAAGSIVSAAVDSSHAGVLSETINGFAFVRLLRQREEEPPLSPKLISLVNVVRSGSFGNGGMKLSSSSSSLSSKASSLSGKASSSSTSSEDSRSFSFTEVTMEATLQQCREKLSQAERRLEKLSSTGETISTKRASNSSTMRRKGLATLLGTDSITSAVSGISSVSTGVTALARSLTSKTMFNYEDMGRTVQPISRWVSSVYAVARNIAKASPAPLGLQAIASMAADLVSMCSKFIALVSLASEDPSCLDQLRTEVVIAESSISTGCSALQLALQGLLSEDIFATSLLLCVKDISASAEEMFALGDQIVSSVKDIHAAPVSNQVRKARSVFSWHLKTASVCCRVAFGKDLVVLSELRAAVSSLRATVTQLLNRTAECITESSESHSFVNQLAAMRWSWSCVNQSCQLYDHLIQLGTKAVESSSSIYVAHVFTDLLATFDRGANSNTTALAEHVDSVVTSLITMFKGASCGLLPSVKCDIVRLEDCLGSFRRTLPSSSPNSGSVFEGFLWIFESILSLIRSIYLADSVQAPSGVSGSKSLLLYLVFLRSLLRLCSSTRFDATSHSVDVAIVKKVNDEFEVLLSSLVPSIGAHLLSESKEDPLPTWDSQIQPFNVILRVDMARFGCFKPVLQKLSHEICSTRERSSREATSREATSARSSTSLGFDDTSDPVPRLSLLKAVGRQGSSLAALTPRSKTIKRINLASISSKFSISTKSAVALTTAEGDVEALNEPAFLEAVQHLLEIGQPPEYLNSLSYKEALETLLVAFPYISTPVSVLEKVSSIVKSHLNPKSAAFPDVAARVRTAIPMLYRLLPQLAQDLRCRLITTRITTMMEDDIAIRAIDDAIKESLDTVTFMERNKAEQKSIALSASPDSKLDLQSIELDVLAEHLTAVDQMYFKAISVSDLLKSAYTKRFNGLSMWAEHSNSLSRWVVSRVLQCQKRSRRALLIGKFIKLIHILWGMKNFSSAITIYLALSMQCISRLTRTWQYGPLNLDGQFARLGEMIRPLKNFSGYREELARVEPPAIPYIAVLTKDLVTLEEIIDRIDEDCLTQQSVSMEETGKLVNLNNAQTVVRVVQTQFRRFKQASYQIAVNPSIFPEIFFSDPFGLIPENETSAASLAVEPPNRPAPSSPTKERLAPAEKLSPNPRRMSVGPNFLESPSPNSTPRSKHRSVPAHARKKSDNSETSSSESFILESSLPTVDSESISEQEPAPFVVPWRTHSSLCSAALEAASESLVAEGEKMSAHYTSHLAKCIKANLADKNHPSFGSIPGEQKKRTRSVGVSGRLHLVTINDFLSTQSHINAALDEYNCSWVIEDDPADAEQARRFMSCETAVSMYSVFYELNYAISRALCASEEHPAVCSRQSTFQNNPGQNHTYLSLNMSYVGARVRKDPTTVETEILSMLSPQTSKLLSDLRGRLVVVGEGRRKIHVTFTLVTRVESLR